MATKQQLEQQIDDLLETHADLKAEYVQLREIYGDVLLELKQAQEELAVLRNPTSVTPVAHTSSYKERMAAAKAKAIASGRAVLV